MQETRQSHVSHDPVSLRRLVEASQRAPLELDTRRERAQERGTGEREDPEHRAPAEQRVHEPDHPHRHRHPKAEENNTVTTASRV